MAQLLLAVAALAVQYVVASEDTRPNIIFVVGDDVGYNDLGSTNGNKTFTPNLNELKADGITLSSYYTFKICSPSRAAMITGRYPWVCGEF